MLTGSSLKKQCPTHLLTREVVFGLQCPPPTHFPYASESQQALIMGFPSSGTFTTPMHFCAFQLTLIKAEVFPS